jgi:hypothetical protein
MCYNADISIQTWQFAIIGFIIGLLGGFPIQKLLFAILFSSMQLVEYFLWTNLNDPDKNRFYSIIGHIVLLLEPLFALFMIQNLQLMKFLVTFYIIFLIIFHTLYLKKMNFYTLVGENRHLDWQFTRNIGNLYSFIWFGLLFFGIYMSKDIVFLLGGIITLLYSLYKENYNNTFTSLWCYLSNIVWVYIIFWVILHHFRNSKSSRMKIKSHS